MQAPCEICLRPFFENPSLIFLSSLDFLLSFCYNAKRGKGMPAVHIERGVAQLVARVVWDHQAAGRERSERPSGSE